MKPLQGNQLNSGFKNAQQKANLQLSVPTKLVKIGREIEAGKRSKNMGLETFPSFRKLPNLYPSTDYHLYYVKMLKCNIQ